MKPCIKAIETDELIRDLQRNGHKAFRARQVCRWLYKNPGLRTFEDMTDLSKDFRSWLEETYELFAVEIEKVDVSSDGTRKILYRLNDGQFIESVLMPDNKTNHTPKK